MENNKMMERKMLELAAKAGGISKQWDGSLVDRGNPCRVWNPLTDDGDALRLAGAMKIDIEIDNSSVEAWSFDDNTGHVLSHVYEIVGDDRMKAIRLAITKIAAEIGKCMA